MLTNVGNYGSVKRVAKEVMGNIRSSYRISKHGSGKKYKRIKKYDELHEKFKGPKSLWALAKRREKHNPGILKINSVWIYNNE